MTLLLVFFFEVTIVIIIFSKFLWETKVETQVKKMFELVFSCFFLFFVRFWF